MSSSSGWEKRKKRERDETPVGLKADVKETAKVGVLPLAMQVDGRIMLNPASVVLRAGDVLFTLASSEAAVAPFQEFLPPPCGRQLSPAVASDVAGRRASSTPRTCGAW